MKVGQSFLPISPGDLLLLKKRHHIFKLVRDRPVTLLFLVAQVGLEREHVGPVNVFQGLLFAGFEEVGQRGAVRTMRFLFLVRLNFEQVGLDRFFEKPAPSRRAYSVAE